jgi:prepilin-type N-terminal cleavage/methylation domain-containing protein
MGRGSGGPAGRVLRAIRRLGAPPTDRDAGFSLVEVIVAISVIGVVMSALGTFYVSSLLVTSAQSGRQAAMQLAADGLERARAQPLSILEAGLADRTQPIAGIQYTQRWTVAQCRYASGGGCTASGSATMEMLRVTVTVTWTERNCPGSTCSYEAFTLVTRGTVDPLFNTVHGTPPAITAVADRSTVVNTTISTLSMARTGGVTPWTWTVTGLPNGLNMNSNGQITGTPTIVGAYPVVVSLRDGFGRTDTEDFTWTITTPPPVLTNPGTRTAITGTATTLSISRTSGTAPFTWTAVNLPAGLSINSTGTISGTPTTVGSSSVTVQVTDATNQQHSVSFTWNVTLPPGPDLTNPGTRTTTAGVATSLAITRTSGTTPFAWTATGLPAGLVIDPTTGTISGTPTTVGSSSVTVRVTDGTNQQDSVSFTWIRPALSLATPGNRTNDNDFNITPLQLTVAGGVLPYTWAHAGTLPAGLSISATGVISGQPTGNGNHPNVRITVTDDSGATITTASFSWTITQ